MDAKWILLLVLESVFGIVGIVALWMSIQDRVSLRKDEVRMVKDEGSLNDVWAEIYEINENRAGDAMEFEMVAKAAGFERENGRLVSRRPTKRRIGRSKSAS